MSLITTAVAPSENPLYQSSSSPSPSPAANAPTLLPSIPSVDHILDVISVYLITSLFLFSLFSLLLILYLRIRSFHRRSRLCSFATHSSQRLLLVSLVSLWALSELLRIPLYRLHALSTPLQIHLCNLHLILSLGFFQPAFFLSVHFLLNTSLKTNNNNTTTTNNNNNLSLLFSLCLPLCLALYLVTYQLHSRVPLPGVFYQSVAFFDDPTAHGCKAVLCTYPLLSAAIFGVFSVAYAVSLLFKSWKVISMAINKRLASRINLLSFTVLMCLAVQVVLMSLTVFFTPVGAMYYFIVFVIFVSVLVCAVVGEGILVIIPILDALSTTIVARKDVRDEEELNE